MLNEKLKRAMAVAYKLCLFFIITVMITAETNGQSVQIFKGTMTEAVAKARQEQKHIYIDAYTDWCPPCIKMDEDLFKDPASAEFINTHFVVLKRECWTDSIGLLFRDEYFSYIYPAHYILNSEGQLDYVFSGYGDNKSFIGKLKDYLANGAPSENSFFTQKFAGQKTFYSLINLSAEAGRDLVASFAYKVDKRSREAELTSLIFDTANLDHRLNLVHQSLAIDEYFYNQFVAAILYHIKGDYVRSQSYVLKAYKSGNVPYGENNFPASPSRLRMLLFLEALNSEKIAAG